MKHLFILALILGAIISPALGEEVVDPTSDPVWLQTMVQGMTEGVEVVKDMNDTEFGLWLVMQMAGIIGAVIQHYHLV